MTGGMTAWKDKKINCESFIIIIHVKFAEPK